MDIATISLIILALMIGMLCLGVPLAFVSGSIAVGLTIVMFGPDALFLVGSRTVDLLSSFELVAVPMFILMASIMERSGVAHDLYRALHVWAGGLPGGLAVITTFVGAILGATTGVIGGEIVLLGLVALPQMLKRGYNRRLAIGTVTSAGSLGTMIPPSIILIFFALTAEVSISQLFLATLVPGLLLAGLYVIYIVVRCTLNPALAPPVSDDDLRLSVPEKLALLKGVVLPILVATLVLASIYLGFASITESAAAGVVGTVIATSIRREFSLQILGAALIQALRTCGMVFWLIFGTNALIGVYNLIGGITFAQQMLLSVSGNPTIILLTMIAVFLILGFFIDWIGILFLTMPIFLPTLQNLGYDLIWFGILFNISMQIAYLTPPFGPACFYLKGVAPENMSLQEIFSAQWPFIGLQMFGLVLVIVFPGIALWLPKLVYG